MELETAIRERRSVREYAAKDVPQEVIDELIEMAGRAPSAGNLQSRDFIVVRKRTTKEALARAAGEQEFVAQAPVVIAVIANLKRVAPYGERGRELYAIQDSAASIQNLLLAIHSKGLGGVWVGAFDEDDAARILDLPSYARPVAIIPLGYPAEKPLPPRLLPSEEFVHSEKW